MLQDLKHAARMLLQTKAWTAVVLISLALGIGANTALFTAVNALTLQTVPVTNPETLVRLKWFGKNDMVRNRNEYGFSQKYQGQDVSTTVSYAIFQQLRAANQTLTDVFACAPIGTLNVIVDGSADIASGFGVSGNYFNVLGVRPMMGRAIIEDDDKAGAPPVAVISSAYWRQRFASAPDVVGKTITVNNTPVTIIGVTAPEFTGIQRGLDTAPDVTVPLSLDAQLDPREARIDQPTYWYLQVLGRLKPGMTYEKVRGNLEAVFQDTAREGRTSYLNSLTPEQRQLSSNRREGSEVPRLIVSSGSKGIYDFTQNWARSASILSVVVVLLLLIVCANVANLLLSRAAHRQREISVRLSMGATRFRLIRQLMTESLLLSSLGGGLGIVIGYWSRQLLPFGQNAAMDWRVFGFVAGVSILTGITFGLVPALRASRVDLAGAMKENSRSVAGSRSTLSKALLVVQVAVSLVLLIGAGLFLRTLDKLRSVDVGFNPESVLMFRVDPQLNRYQPDRVRMLYRQIEEALEAMPGIRSVGLTATVLLSGNTSITSMYIEGIPGDNDVHVMSISPGFLETMQIPLLAGRDFSERDVHTSPKVAILNESAARKYFPNENPIGRRIGSSPEQSGETEIVGVIRDTKYNSLRDAAPPTLFYCAPQNNPRAMSFVMRTEGDPRSLIEPVRAAVRRIDPSVPLTRISTQKEQIEARFAQERLFAMAYSLFGALALLLAAIGLFGLMSYNVARRTNEIGIRMALGAQRRDVLRMVLTESLLLVSIGIVIGMAAAVAAGRFVATVLFGLAPTDATAISAAIVVMISVSALAGYLPARRASRLDPMNALRYE